MSDLPLSGGRLLALEQMQALRFATQLLGRLGAAVVTVGHLAPHVAAREMLVPIELVEQYAALGIHRTGTAVDAATVDWMAEQLVDAGLTVERVPYDFDQWTAPSVLTADDVAIEHLPVFHEFVGSVDTTNVHAEVIDPLFGGFPVALHHTAQ